MSKIKQKQKINLRELYSLNSFWKPERNWKTFLLDYSSLLLLTGEGFLLSKVAEINVYISVSLFGLAWLFARLYLFMRSFHRFYKSLKAEGIQCSEIELLSTTFSVILLNHRSSNLLKISGFLYSAKTQKEVFELIAADWQEEHFEALSKKEIWKARWINARHTYAFLAAMWQKSPVSDLIEFISKLAK